MAHSALTVSKLFEFFDCGALVEGATKKKCRSAMRKLAAIVGNIEAAEVNPAMIGQYQVGMRQQGMSPAGVRSYFGAASQVFGWAVRQKLLESNPFAEADKIRPGKTEVVTFTSEEIEALCNAACRQNRRDPSARLRWLAILLVTSQSGLRIGEALNLRWEDLDLDEAIIYIRYRPDRFGEFWTWGTKGKSDRRVPMSQELLTCFCRLQVVARWRYPLLKQCTCERLQQGVGSLTEDTRKMPYTNLYREFRQIRKLANEGRAEPIKNGCFHTMRKTAVTGWAAKGVPVRDVQYAAGHATVSTTLNIYTAINRRQSLANIRSAIS